MISIASQNELRFTLLLGGIFVVLGSILGGLGEAKWKPKSIFWRFFSDVFLECVLASIWGGFLEARNLKINKNHTFFNGFCSFSKNRRLRKKYEKTSILESFLAAKTMKNREKKVLKTMWFLT